METPALFLVGSWDFDFDWLSCARVAKVAVFDKFVPNLLFLEIASQFVSSHSILSASWCISHIIHSL